MKQVLKKYITTVYVDGSIDHKEIIVEEDFNTLLNKTSERVRQYILVVLQVKSLREKVSKSGKIDYNSIYNEAVGLVGEGLSIRVSSVRDKLERQNNMKTEEVIKLLEDFFENGNLELKNALTKAIVKHKEKDDRKAIERLFEKI